MNSVVISLDAELAWGFHDQDHPPSDRIAAGRTAWQWLVDAFETYSIPATWAVVGHLFLESCDGVHAGHACVDGWFDRDPGGDESTEPTWFGRSLVDAIEESPVEHEIASHTFSHVEFGAAETTAAIARAELDRSVRVAERRGLSLDSVVFPRNDVGHLDALGDAGFTAYRGQRPDSWYDRLPFRAFWKGADHALSASKPPIVDPAIDANGLVNVPASLFLFSFEGLGKRAVQAVRDDPVVRRVEAGLETLSTRDQGIFHLWLHPNNLTTAADYERMNRVLDLVDRYRTARGLSVKTMREVAAEVRRAQLTGTPSAGKHLID